MAVAYKSQGAGVVTEASGGALSPLCPATVDAGDILIAHCAYEGTTTTPDTPAGWTLLGGPYTVESAYRHWIFGKIADGTEDGAAVAFGTPAVTTLRVARVYSFSGRVDGTITALVPAASFAHISHATDPQMPTVTTEVAGALAVACTFQADDNPQASATGATGGTWAEAVAEYVQSATTPDTALHIQTCTPTSDPGTVTGGSVSTLNDPCGVIGFQIKPTAAQTISPSGIATAEAFGSPTLHLKIFPSGAATAEAFGTTKVNMSIQAAGNVGTAEAFGTAELTQGVPAQTISPSAIASAEAFGTLQVNLKIFPSSIASGEAFGTTKVNQQISPTGIASAEAFGTPNANFIIAPTGITSTETFGSPSVHIKVFPTGIPSSESFGTAQINLKIIATGIVSGEAFGDTTVTSSGDSIAPTGIPSSEAFGTPAIIQEQFISPSAIASAEAFGTAAVIPDQVIAPASIASGENFGTPSIKLRISPTGISSSEAFGSPTITIIGPQFIGPEGISSGERFGRTRIGQVFERLLGNTILVGILPPEQSDLNIDAVTQLRTGRSSPRRTLTLTAGISQRIQLTILSHGLPMDLAGASAVLRYFAQHGRKKVLAELAVHVSKGVLRAAVDPDELAPGTYYAEVGLVLPSGVEVFAPGDKPLTLVVT